MVDFYDDSELVDPDYPDERDQERDLKIDDAKSALVEFLAAHDKEVFYERQLEVILEKDFYHWITSKALHELVEEGNLKSVLLEPEGQYKIRVYFDPGHRYWRRQANEIAALVREFSSPSVTSAIGLHGEMMFDVALPSAGFLPRARDVRTFNGREWNATAHTLDRIFERDGIFYGTEIKNTLKYIDLNELQIKIRMCHTLQLRPLFIVRMAPKHYVHLVNQAQGFTLIFKYQLYPIALTPLATRIKKRLSLPVDTPRRIEDGTTQRLLNWHNRHRA